MMYRISPEFYCKVAELLLEQVDLKEYYSGMFEFDFENVRCRMVLSAVVYRRDMMQPEGMIRIVADVIPVWWEMHTEIDGQEQLNDFSFNQLREHIKER